MDAAIVVIKMSNIFFVNSKYNKKQLVCRGYLFGLDGKKGNTSYWQCVKRSSLSCYTRAITQVNDNGVHKLIKVNGEHSHIPEPEKILDLNLKEKLKQNAVSNMDTPSQVIQNLIQTVPVSKSIYLPSTSSMKMVIHRARNNDHPNLPKDLADFVVPGKYQDFLLAHYSGESGEDETILLFGTKEKLQLLQRSPFWIMDGTFQTCPDLFYQIYTIHGLVSLHENALPSRFRFDDKEV